jgi:hypothetical protein
VPDARVEVVVSASPAAVTDGNGYFDLAATLLVSGHVFGTGVTITKAGYEDTHTWAAGLNDVTQDFRLYPIMNMAAGEAAHLAITPDNSLCGIEEEFRCRTVHVVMPSSGTLVLDTIAEDPSNAFWIVIGDRFNVHYRYLQRIGDLGRRHCCGTTESIYHRQGPSFLGPSVPRAVDICAFSPYALSSPARSSSRH